MYNIECEYIERANDLQEQKGRIKENLLKFVNYVKTAPKDKVYYICAENNKLLHDECFIPLKRLAERENSDFSWAYKSAMLYGRSVIFYSAKRGAEYEGVENLILCRDIQAAYCLGISEESYTDFYSKLFSRLLRNPGYKLIQQETIQV